MKPQNLRVGNYVWDDYSGEMIVHQISDRDGIELSNLKLGGIGLRGLYSSDNIEGIEITKDWLIRFGFVDVEAKVPELKGFYSLNITHELMLVTNNGIWEFGANVVGQGPTQFQAPQLKFVHELQNLIFAFTGIELK